MGHVEACPPILLAVLEMQTTNELMRQNREKPQRKCDSKGEILVHLSDNYPEPIRNRTINHWYITFTVIVKRGNASVHNRVRAIVGYS